MPLHRTVSDWGPWKSSQDNQYMAVMAQHFHKSKYVGRPKSFVTYSELDLGEDYRNLYRRRSTYECEKYKKSSSFVSDYELPQSGTITPASGFSRSSSPNSVFSDASSVSRPKPSRHSYAFEQEQVDNYLAEQIRGRDNPFRKENPTDKPRQHTLTNEMYTKKHDLIQTSNKKKEYRKGQNYFDHFERDTSLDETSKCLTEVKLRKRKAFLEKQKVEDQTSLKSTFHSNSSRHVSSENEQISKRWSLDLSNIDKERKTLFNVFKNDGIVRKTGGGSRMDSFKESGIVPVNSNEVKEFYDGKAIHKIINNKKDVKNGHKTHQEDIHESETARVKDFHTMDLQNYLEKSMTEDTDEYIIAEGPEQYNHYQPITSDTSEASVHDSTGSKIDSLHAAEYKVVDANRKDTKIEVANDKSSKREHFLLLVNKRDEKMQEDTKKIEDSFIYECSVKESNIIYPLIQETPKRNHKDANNGIQTNLNERDHVLLLGNKSKKMQQYNKEIEDVRKASLINECSLEESKILNPLIQETPERNHKDANHFIVELFDTIQSMSSTSTDRKSSLLVKRNETSQKEKLHLLTQVIAPGTDNTRISHPTSPIVSKIQEIRQFIKAASEPLVQKERSEFSNGSTQETSIHKEGKRDGYEDNPVLHIEQKNDDIEETNEASGIFWADLVPIQESPSSEDENEKVKKTITILRPITYEKQGLNLRDREANRRKSWMLNTLEEQDRKRRNRHSTPHFLNLL